MHSPTHSVVLAALDQLGMTDRAIEEVVGLPQAFLSKFRHGRSSGKRAAISLAKLVAFLKSKGVSVDDEIPTEIPSEICEAIERADTPRRIRKVIKLLIRGMARGEVDYRIGSAIESLLREHRQVFKLEEELRARTDPRKPAKVIVEFRNDWKGAPACPTCGGTGVVPAQGFEPKPPERVVELRRPDAEPRDKRKEGGAA